MKQMLALLNRAKRRLSCLWRQWLAERRLERNLEEVGMRYAPMLAEAKRAKDEDKYQEVLGHLLVDENLFLEPVLYRRTDRLMRRARGCLVSVPAKPSVGEHENQFWRRDQTGRFWYLKPEAELELRRAVRDARRQSVIFWISIVFGFLGLLIGLVSVWRK